MNLKELTSGPEAGQRAADGAAGLIADGLTGHGLDVLMPSHHLKVTNVPGTLCEVTIGDDGSVEWECRQCQGAGADPARITGIVRHVLGGEPGGGAGMARAECRSGRSVKAIAGRMLAGCGLRVSVEVAYVDQHFFEVYSEIDVTNPARPGRGRVRVADDGSVLWQCRLSTGAPDAPGLDAREVTETIAAALAECWQYGEAADDKSGYGDRG